MAKRQYLLEIAKKHGTSKSFYYAIIFSLISTLCSIPGLIYIIIRQWNDYLTISIVNLVIAVITIILSIGRYLSLRNVYSFFKGESKELFGLQRYFRIEIATLVVFFFSTVANFLGIIETRALQLDFSYAIIPSFFLTVCLIPLLLPLKKAIDHGNGAARDELVSRITIPMKVLCILLCFPNFSTLTNLLLYNTTAIVLIEAIAVIIKVISQILFAIVMFEFEGDIKRVSSEWKRKNSNRKSKNNMQKKKG